MALLESPYTSLDPKIATTLESFRQRLEALYTIIDTIPVDGNTVHASIPVSDATTFPVINADSLASISTSAKERIKAYIALIEREFSTNL